MSKISIQHIGHAHSDWLRSIHFYRQELEILRYRLTEIGGKNTARDVAATVDHFEIQFVIRNEQIDELEHQIGNTMASITKQAQQNGGAGYIDKEYSATYQTLQDKVVAEEKAINELRHEFNRFSAEWM